MSKISEKISGIVGVLFVVVSILIVLLMYVGGKADPILNAAGEEMTVPKFTDGLLYWTAFLFIAALLITIIGAFVTYAKSFAQNPKSAAKSLIPLVLFALIFVVSWQLGSGERMSIIGYEGVQNEGSWAKFVDMVIYSIYTLFVLVIVTIFGSRIYTSLK